VDNGEVTFKVTCQASGKVKVGLQDSRLENATMGTREWFQAAATISITSLDYLPMVSSGMFMTDVYRKGYTPFSELLQSSSFDYRDTSYGKLKGTLEYDRKALNDYVQTCQGNYKKKIDEKVQRQENIKRQSAVEANHKAKIEADKKQAEDRKEQLERVNQRKIRAADLKEKETRLVSVNKNWEYKGMFKISDSVPIKDGIFISVNLSTYQLYQQIDQSTYLFKHVSNLPHFRPVVLSSTKFYKEGYNGPVLMDVISYGTDFSKIGQVIRMTEVE